MRRLVLVAAMVVAAGCAARGGYVTTPGILVSELGTCEESATRFCVYDGVLGGRYAQEVDCGIACPVPPQVPRCAYPR